MCEPNLMRVHRILDKLNQVRLRGLSCFGSDSHGFRLKPPASEAELGSFETKHRIRLPDDYRTFLKHAGNGGAGPYYGLFPLEKWNDFADWVLDHRPDDFLQRSCPLYPELDPKPNWADEFGEASPYQGTLSLGSRGCSYAMQLIVVGPYAGRVVYVDADGSPPYMVREPDFLCWYERWLDELLQGYKIDWFGYGLGGGEVDFFGIVNDPHTSDGYKAEAARAFCRLPRLTETANAGIVAFCRHPVCGVRAGACATIRTFKIQAGEEEAALLLDDPSAEVRREAVWTVMKLDPQRWSDLVLGRLRNDPDGEVASSAFCELKEAGALCKAELLRIIEQSPLGNLRYLAANVVDWADEDLALLIGMLSDSHTQVRFYATLGLRKLKARDALPQILDLLARENDPLVVESILKMLGELGDPCVVSTLLDWTKAPDDFHRLDAMEALAKIGDERAVPIAQAMLREDREPVRREASGHEMTTSIHTIRVLVQKSLKESPNQALRKLVKWFP